MKRVTRRIVFLFILVGIMSSSLSLAWRDVSQFKTNSMKTTKVANNVVLIEDYQEKEDWSEGESIVKKVAVRNGQDGDDLSKYVFEDAYVRVQFKEFLEIGKKTKQYSAQRYMVDEIGEFVKFKTLELAQKYLEDPVNSAPSDARIEQMEVYPSLSDAPKGGYFYIASRLKNPYGKYGKFLTVGAIEGDYESVEGPDGPQKGNPGAVHDFNGIAPESLWSIHKWDQNVRDHFAKASVFTNYVTWNLGTDVIPLNQWDGQPSATWIIDTESDQGWVYWGQALKHGKDAEYSKSLTSNVLESVKLANQPGSGAHYFLNVKLDAVNQSDLKLWDDAPKQVLESYRR